MQFYWSNEVNAHAHYTNVIFLSCLVPATQQKEILYEVIMSEIVWINVCITAVTVFRFIMYTFFFDINNKIKVSEEVWENRSDVREILRKWGSTLRILFIFRLVIAYSVCYVGDYESNVALLFASLIYCILFLVDVTGLWDVKQKEKSIMANVGPIPTIISLIDLFLVIIGVLIWLIWL